MKKYYLALTFSSIAIFILAMVAYGMVVKPFFTPEYIAYAIALAIYIVIGNFICFIIIYKANKYTKKLINDSRKHIKTEKYVCSICGRRGKKLPLPEWKVDENGQVPSYTGPGPDGVPACMTDKLIVDLSDVSTSYSSGSTSMVPACPDEDGVF